MILIPIHDARVWTRLLAVLLVLPLTGAVTGCGAGDDGRPTVVAAFYPLQYVAQRIAGTHARVEGLTSPGVEPHDLELTPRQTATLTGADLVVYEHGFQPAVDQAVRNDPPDHAVDAAQVVDLRTEDGQADPHFWLDPTLLARVAQTVTDQLSRVEPGARRDFEAANRRVQRDLRTLDGELHHGLAGCRTRSVVVSHDAFEYFGARYGLDVHAITGLSPSSEPSAEHLAELRDLVEAKGITTVFSERLASPAAARTLADEAGVTTGVLDPVEGLSGSTRGEDYLSLMRRNLAALRKAGDCR